VSQTRPPGHPGPGGQTATSIKESDQPVHPSIVKSQLTQQLGVHATVRDLYGVPWIRRNTGSMLNLNVSTDMTGERVNRAA